jgi:hypothetical protein
MHAGTVPAAAAFALENRGILAPIDAATLNINAMLIAVSAAACVRLADKVRTNPGQHPTALQDTQVGHACGIDQPFRGTVQARIEDLFKAVERFGSAAAGWVIVVWHGSSAGILPAPVSLVRHPEVRHPEVRQPRVRQPAI